MNAIKETNYKKAVFYAEYLNDGVLKLLFDFKLDNWQASDEKNKIVNSEQNLTPSNIRPFGKWFLYHFGNKMVKYAAMWGLFSVDKKDIRKYNIIRYQILLKQLEVSSNPEVGHYIERSWAALFMPFIHTLLRTN